LPQQKEIEQWVRQSLVSEFNYQYKQGQQSDNKIQANSDIAGEFELTIRIVDKDEIQALNKSYRHQDKVTNVLSFPFEPMTLEAISADIQPVKIPLLGDIVICHDVVIEQAQQQHKLVQHHWAHMVVHGVLHLLSYDHINDEDAGIMEALEVTILQQLAISDPYQ